MKIAILENWENRSDGIKDNLEKKIDFDIYRTYKNEFPNINEYEHFIISGGPQSLTKLEDFPYLKKTVELTKGLINENKKVLGICLGHQIIGKALDLEIKKSKTPEVGWYNINFKKENKNLLLFEGVPSDIIMFQYHLDEIFEVKEGVEIFAYSDRCKVEGIKLINQDIYGIQFHPEINIETSKYIIENYGKDYSEKEFNLLKKCGQYNKENSKKIFDNFIKI